MQKIRIDPKQLEDALGKMIDKLTVAPLKDLKKGVWDNMQKFAKKIDEMDSRIKGLEKRRE